MKENFKDRDRDELSEAKRNLICERGSGGVGVLGFGVTRVWGFRGVGVQECMAAGVSA